MWTRISQISNSAGRLAILRSPTKILEMASEVQLNLKLTQLIEYKEPKGTSGAKRGRPTSAAGSSTSNRGPKPKSKPKPKPKPKPRPQPRTNPTSTSTKPGPSRPRFHDHSRAAPGGKKAFSAGIPGYIEISDSSSSDGSGSDIPALLPDNKLTYNLTKAKLLVSQQLPLALL